MYPFWYWRESSVAVSPPWFLYVSTVTVNKGQNDKKKKKHYHKNTSNMRPTLSSEKKDSGDLRRHSGYTGSQQTRLSVGTLGSSFPYRTARFADLGWLGLNVNSSWEYFGPWDLLKYSGHSFMTVFRPLWPKPLLAYWDSAQKQNQLIYFCEFSVLIYRLGKNWKKRNSSCIKYIVLSIIKITSDQDLG